MKITPEEVSRVAHLARLRLDTEQLEKLTVQLNDILINIDKLAELDTTGVSATNQALAFTGAMREDMARESLTRERALAGAPASDGESFVVPRIIGL
jgi:aspartyl-tRNA(Asn)/glutamyl-tRNA(Gln) amidotransferase subunit C